MNILKIVRASDEIDSQRVRASGGYHTRGRYCKDLVTTQVTSENIKYQVSTKGTQESKDLVKTRGHQEVKIKLPPRQPSDIYDCPSHHKTA